MGGEDLESEDKYLNGLSSSEAALVQGEIEVGDEIDDIVKEENKRIRIKDEELETTPTSDQGRAMNFQTVYKQSNRQQQ